MEGSGPSESCPIIFSGDSGRKMKHITFKITFNQELRDRYYCYPHFVKTLRHKAPKEDPQGHTDRRCRAETRAHGCLLARSVPIFPLLPPLGLQAPSGHVPQNRCPQSSRSSSSMLPSSPLCKGFHSEKEAVLLPRSAGSNDGGSNYKLLQ